MSREPRRYLSDEEQRSLAARVQQGDQAAFGTLYEHFSDAVGGYIAGRLNAAEDAKDIVSETFTQTLALLKAGRYDPKFAFYTFIKTIADSQIAHHLRKTHLAVPAPNAHESRQYLRRLRPLAEIPEVASLPQQDVDAAAYELLLLVLSCGSKPHQAVSFCLISILDWRPREIIQELGSRSLFALTRQVYDDFAHQGMLHARHQLLCRDHCPWFWQRLVSPVGEVYPEQEYQRLAGRSGPVGDRALSSFFGTRPSASLSDWCHKVRLRARKALETGMLPMEDRPASIA